MLAYPDIDPIAVSLGPLKVHWYGLMYVVGFVGAWWLGRLRAARLGLKPDDIGDMLSTARWAWCWVGAWAMRCSTGSIA